MNQSSILIVTSDDQIARDLRDRLDQLGYRIVGVSNGDEGTFGKIENLKPDLILTDIRLTHTRGGIKTWELIHSTYSIPVIYITGEINREALQRTRLANPSGFVFMPYDDWQLLTTIETAMIRYQLENSLRESRKWLSTTLTSIGEGVIATDAQGNIQFINPTALELVGWTQAEALGQPLQNIFTLAKVNSPEFPDLARIKNWIRDNQRSEFDGLLISRDGRSTSVEASATLINDEHGKSFGNVLIFRDVTKQKEALQEIKQQANRAEALVKAASKLNKQIELEMVLNEICIITNRALKARATAVFLLDRGKESFRNMASYSDDEGLKAYDGSNFEFPVHLLGELLSQENPVVIIQDLQAHPDWPHLEFAKKQSINTLVITGLFQRDKMIGTLISVISTEHKTIPPDDTALLQGLADQAASAIVNAELFEQVRMGRERQRRLAKNLVDIQEAERRTIARDLHDHLGQILTGLQFMLEGVKNKANIRQKSELNEIQKVVGDVIEQVREMSLNLRPSMLDDMGLIPTLQWHFSRYTSQTGIKVRFQHDEILERVPSEIETAAYRIVQEALTNVARYAQTQEVFVGIMMHNDSIWLEIVDKGRGFDTAAVMERPSTGLGGMRERASLVGGYVVVESYIDQGTQIVAALPLTDRPIERRKYDRKNPSG